MFSYNIKLNIKISSLVLISIVLINLNSISLFNCQSISDTDTKNISSIVFNNVSESQNNTEATNESIATTVIPEIIPVLATNNSDSLADNSDNGIIPLLSPSLPADSIDTIDELQITPKKPILISSKKPNNSSNIDAIDLTKPKSCSDMKRVKLEMQPIKTESSYLKKCCPMGESLHPSDGPGGKTCNYENKPFDPTLITAALYKDCIEDLEDHYLMEVEVGNQCNESYIYSKETGDKLFIMQNGSLLTMDSNGSLQYDIFDDYCLDVDYETGELVGIVCVTSIDAHIGGAQTVLFALFMFISVLCLIFVAYIHFAIRELRTVHGLSLGCMSTCLTIGFSLYIYAQLIHGGSGTLGYLIQFFLLSYFCWLVMLSLNIVVTVWYFLPRYVTITRLIRYGRLAIYGCIAFIIPLSLVITTYSKRLPGMPSYFYQAYSESVTNGQRYFIPPVSFGIFLTFCFLVVSYFGFRNCEKILRLRGKCEYTAIVNGRNGEDQLPIMDEHFLDETKQDAFCISILLVIISITWILEVITFYVPGDNDYMGFMEIMNGLQGFFILMIFIVGRKRRTVIIRWWHDRGSHEITPVPTQPPKEIENDV